MTSSGSGSSESKFELNDAEGDPLKQLELLETLNHQTATGVLSLYHELGLVGELQHQHAQHIGLRGHIKDFTANKEGKVIATERILSGCVPKGTSTALLWAWVEEFVPLWAQVEGGQACILLAYTRVLLDRLKNGGSAGPHKILVEEVSSGNVEALGAEELEAAQRFSEDLLRVIDREKKLEKDDGALEEITADPWCGQLVLPEIGHIVQTRSADDAEWSEAAIIVEVGTEENGKKGQLNN